MKEHHTNKATSGTHSDEKLVHFRCGSCEMWWSIADIESHVKNGDPSTRTWFCPWCGIKQESKKDG